MNWRKSSEFLTVLRELLLIPEFADMQYRRHHTVNRLHHSVNVAYIAYRFYRLVGRDPRDATIAALCHDFFENDWRSKKYPLILHPWVHAREALEQTQRYIKLTRKQQNAILSHMWPLSRALPHCGMAWVIWAADKICTLIEVLFKRERAN